MAQGCLKCLKYTMCVANFLCFICGVAVLGFGIFITVKFKMTALMPNVSVFTIANMLLISGIVITCVAFLGFLGALKENRCLLLTFFLLLFLLMLVELAAACLLLVREKEITDQAEKDLVNGLLKAKTSSFNNTELMSDWDLVQGMLDCCGVKNVSDWGSQVPKSCCKDQCNTSQPVYREKGCWSSLKDWFNENFLTIGISIIIICVIEVLGMCFSMTLFCHISRSGLGYKL
ncbi:leukocyte surface antigen CD53-like [Salarias fasciatus]|uniref:Tetraspanin n=1 Tax=Salarias fasciatus TaxID=181472 RepID=A0A672HKY9_SALFA|nr:leukocyte surface antigen CD53-like [Salarias fasciatus]